MSLLQRVCRHLWDGLVHMGALTAGIHPGQLPPGTAGGWEPMPREPADGAAPPEWP